MSGLRLWVVFYILQASSLQHALGQESLPIMELFNDTSNIINNSGCNTGLMNDVDYFTVRGKVNKNGSNTTAFIDTNLYLQAVRDPSKNDWASQCRPNLTVCSPSLNMDCYCERKDPNGDYHLVMTIMAKSIYSGGKLMLSWNDARSPSNPPVTSNIVDYYPGPIWDSVQVNVTLQIMRTDGSFVENTNFNGTKSLNIPYDPNMTNLTFCVYNLEAIELIKIEMNGKMLANTTTEECVTLDNDEKYKGQVLNMSFAESGGCERTDSYTLHLTSDVTTTPIIPVRSSSTTDSSSGSTTVTPTTTTNGPTSTPEKKGPETWKIIASSVGFLAAVIVFVGIVFGVRKKCTRSLQLSSILSRNDKHELHDTSPILSHNDQDEHHDNQNEHHDNQNEHHDNQNEHHDNQNEHHDNQHEHHDNQQENEGSSVPMSSAGYQRNMKSVSPPTTTESTSGEHQQQGHDVVYHMRNKNPIRYSAELTPSYTREAKPNEHHHDEYDKITPRMSPASKTSLSLSPPTTMESTSGEHQQQGQDVVYHMWNKKPFRYSAELTPSYIREAKPNEHHHDEYDKITPPMSPASKTSL